MQYVFVFSTDFSFAFKDGPTTFWTTTPEAQVKSFLFYQVAPRYFGAMLMSTNVM